MSTNQVKKKPVYIVVPRKLMITWAATFICMIILTASSIQWANYVDRRSNQRWCGVVNLFNKAYETNPPPTVIGKQIAAAMFKLSKEFGCK